MEAKQANDHRVEQKGADRPDKNFGLSMAPSALTTVAQPELSSDHDPSAL
jgi:hypothetical protein